MTTIPKDHARVVQSLVIVGKLAACAHSQGSTRVSKQLPISIYEVGNLDLVAYGKAFQSMKWPEFTSKFYGPCVVVRSKHPRYELKFSSGRQTREAIHARRLIRYYARNI